MRKIYSLFLTCLFLCCGVSAVWGETLAVYGSETTTNSYIPLYGDYIDTGSQLTQFIYPQADIAALAGKNITAMEFYTWWYKNLTFGPTFTIKIMEVAKNSYYTSSPSAKNTSSATTVFTGKLSVDASNKMSITFSTPFECAGNKDLLIEFSAPKGSTAAICSFYGKSASGQAYYKTVSSKTTEKKQDFLPRVTFTYETPSSGGGSSCDAPTDMAVPAANITAHGAKVTWTKGEATSSTLEYKLHSAGDAAWAAASTGNTAGEYTFTSGLSANTKYDVRVKNVCAEGESAYTATASFTTKCEPYETSSLPYSTGFESTDCATGALPSCWSRITSTAYPAANANSPKTGSQCLRFYGPTEQYAVLPQFEADVKDLIISFYYRNWYNGGSTNPQLIVGYMTNPDDASTFVQVEAMSRLGDYGSEKSEVNMSSAAGAGAHYIALKYTANSYTSMDWINVDDVTVEVAPTCIKPASINEPTAITSEGATITWAAGSDETQWQYVVLAAGAAESWTSGAVIVNTREAVITGKSPNTDYDFYVRSYCGVSEQSKSVKTSFHTDCAARSIPWTENFDALASGTSTGPAPDCWALIGANGASYPNVYVAGYTPYGGPDYFKGTKALFCVSSSSTDSYIILPKMDASLNTLQIAFSHMEESATSSGTLTVGYITNIKDASTFVPISGGACSNTTKEWADVEVSLASVPSAAAGTARIAIKYGKGGSSNYYTAIDDITISELPSCPKPSITATDVIFDGATITWAEGSSTNKWRLQYKASGDADWSNANSGNLIAASSFNLTGLTSGTTYQVRAQAECAGDWSTIVSFTPQCLKPSTPEVPQATITTTSAVVNWTAGNGEDEWYLQYKKSSESVWSAAIHVTTNPTYTLTGLESGTTYGVHVTAGCKEDYTASTEFDTECAVVSSFPWLETFESQTANTIAKCWDISASGTSTKSGDYKYRVWGVYEYNSNKMLRMYNYMVNDGTAIIYSPSITIPNNGKEYELSFDYNNRADCGAFKVKVSKDAGANFTEVGSYANATSVNEYTNPGTFTSATISLAAYAGETIILQFYSLANYGNGAIFVDNLSIHEKPSCSAINAATLQESAVTAHTATVSWTAAGSETNWKLQYKAESGSWSAEQSVATTPSFNLTGLAENTRYYVKVKAVCDPSNNIESEYTADDAFYFSTDCDAKTATWNEGFESQEANKIPACWDEISPYAASAYTKVNASAANESSLGVQVYVNSTYTEIALLPVFETEIKNLKISFEYKNQGTGSNYAALEVGYYSGGTFTNVTTLEKTTSFVASGDIDMPADAPNGARIAFRTVGKKNNYNGSAYIDNIEVALKLTCKAPVNVQRTALTNEGATFTWEASDLGETQYDYACVIADVVLTDGDWNTLTDGLRSVTLTGKTANQAYDFYVRSHCGSAPTAKQTFTPTCLAPTDLAASAITSTSATISWTGNAKAVRYKASDAADWTKETISGTSYNFSGVASTTYLVQVQAACAIEDDEAWTASLEFTTKCAPLTISAAVPYTNDFESETTGALPACWDRVSATAYPQVVSGSAAYGADEYTDKKCVCFYASGEQYLVLPAFTPATVDELSISFWYRNSSSTLTLGYMEADGTTFHSIEALENRSAYGDNIYELELTGAPAEAAYIAIQYIGTGDFSNAYVDEFTVRYTPTCKKPTDLTAPTANINSNSAQLSWTETGTATAWNIQYQLAPATDWTAATTVAVTTNPYTLTGLAEGTSYVARVQADCGAGDENKSDWSDETTFTTHCAAITAIPFTEDFNAALNHCWELHPEDPTYYPAYVSGGKLVLPGGKEGAGHVVVLPEISADLSNATFSIRYSIASDAETPEVGYITTPGDVSTFEVLTTLDKSATIARIALNTLPVEAKNLAIRYDGTGSIERDFSIDEIRISHVEVFADDASITDNSSRLTALAGGTMDVILERSLARTGNYASLSLPFALSAEQLADTKCPLNGFVVREYDHAEVDRTADIVDIYLRTVNAVEAGKAYFVRYDGTADALQPMEFRDVTVAGSTIVPTEDGGTLTLHPVFDPFHLEANNETTLYLSTNNLLYYPTAEGYIKGFRAYFNIPAGSVMMPVIRRGAVVRISEGHSTPTELKNVQTTGNNVLKRIENNQVIIIRNGVKYTIQGQKIQ